MERKRKKRGKERNKKEEGTGKKKERRKEVNQYDDRDAIKAQVGDPGEKSSGVPTNGVEGVWATLFNFAPGHQNN